MWGHSSSPHPHPTPAASTTTTDGELLSAAMLTQQETDSLEEMIIMSSQDVVEREEDCDVGVLKGIWEGGLRCGMYLQ